MGNVYGEETLDIPFSGGLYLHEDYSAQPDGTNIVQKNWIRSRTGKLRIRAGLKKAMSGFTRAINNEDPRFVRKVELYPPDYPYDYLRRAHSVFRASVATAATPTTYVDYPAIVLPVIDYVGVANHATFKHITASQVAATIENTQAIAAANSIYYSGCCQYKDRMYFCGRTNEWGTGAGQVCYITGFSYTAAPALTITTVLTGGLEGIVTFRDRIFGWVDDKIFYTETALVGGYPETWNSTVNIIQVQSSEESCTIHNILPLNDKLYIFTDRGLYQLYAVGSSSNWYLQTISRDYRTFGRLGSCLVKDTIVFTDRKKVYIMNSGESISEIHAPIGKEIDRSTSVTVIPFEDGVIISTYQMLKAPKAVSYTGVTYTYNHWYGNQSHNYYFDGQMWSELQIRDSLGVNLGGSVAGNLFLVAGFTNKVTHANTGVPSSYLVGFIEAGDFTGSVSNTWFTIYYTPLDKSGDEIFTSAFGSTTLQSIQAVLETKWYNKASKFIRTKYGFFAYHGRVVSIADIGFKSATVHYEESAVTVVAAVNELNSSTIKVAAPQLVHQINGVLNVNTKTTGVTLVNEQFVLDSINLVVHSENRDMNAKSTV